MSRPLSVSMCGERGSGKVPLPLRVETISVRSGPGPVCENLRLSLSSPAITWTAESIAEGTWESAGA